jgi:hypothetical protein
VEIPQTLARFIIQQNMRRAACPLGFQKLNHGIDGAAHARRLNTCRVRCNRALACRLHDARH